tara:strand:- start:4066 stop:4707 length:642 start_codon:yes stop_codon:yes gene_type:complete
MARRRYRKIKRDYLDGEYPPIPMKPRPTNSDYSVGSYKRYFVTKNNDRAYIKEIDKKQFDTLQLKGKGLNAALYDGVEVDWRIKGRKNDEYKNGIRMYPGVFESNERNIEHHLKKYPQLASILSDKLEYAIIDTTNNSQILTTNVEDHFHFVYVDDMGNGHTSEHINPKNPNIKHYHEIRNWIIQESQDGCYPNCFVMYGYAGLGLHSHEIIQ